MIPNEGVNSGANGMLIGLAVPPAGPAAAAVEAAIFGWVLYRRLRAGDRGRALGGYGLFLAMASAMLAVDALRAVS
jgi:hypothetical protein